MAQRFTDNSDFAFHTSINNHLPKICFMTYYKLRELAEPTILGLSNRANIKCIEANKVDAFVSTGSNASI